MGSSPTLGTRDVYPSSPYRVIETLYSLPFPSSGASGTKFEELPTGDWAIVFPDIAGEGAANDFTFIFSGVEAFQCTYFNAITPIPGAYDSLVNVENSEWLASIKKQMAIHKRDTSQLRHLAIGFDDGPQYEFICKAFRVEDPHSDWARLYPHLHPSG